jgi:signal transduction histidine kinase
MKIKSSYNVINRYSIIISLSYLLVIAIILLNSYKDYEYFIEHEKKVFKQKLIERKLTLDSILGYTTNYIQRLKILMSEAQYWSSDLSNIDTSRPSHTVLPPRGSGQGISVIQTTNKNSTSKKNDELRLALGFQQLAKQTHETTNYYGWSYFASPLGNVFVYPSFKTDLLYKHTNTNNIDDATAVAVWNRQHWNMSLPANNPTKESFWTHIYSDDAGNGLEVTHGAPVYQDDVFIGMVATDITLNFLDSIVQNFDYPHGELFIINNFNQVLASTNNKNNQKITMAHEVLGANILKKITSKRRNLNTQTVHNNTQYYWTSLNNAQWTIIYSVPQADLTNAFIKANKSYIYIIILFTFAMGLVQLLIRKRIIKPALSIMRFIKEDAYSGKAKQPKVPNEWQEWLETVSTLPALRSVTANLPGVVFKLVRKKNHELKVVFVSEGFNKFLKIPNKTDYQLEDILVNFSINDRNKFLKELSKSEKERTSFNYEIKLSEQDECRWLLFSAEFSTSGSIATFDGMILDITERKNIEIQLNQLNKDLEKRVASESKKRLMNEQAMIQQSKLASMGEMITNISHQWRQPLANIAGIHSNIKQKILLGNLDQDTLNSLLSEENDIIQHMSETIDSFKKFLAPTSEQNSFSLNDAVIKTLKIVSPMLKHNNINLNYVNNNDLYISGNAILFSHAILNIITNAKNVLIERAVTNPTITINLDSDETLGYISITDNAGGIEENDIDKIFEPFFTTRKEGQGLGLYMAKMIIEKNKACCLVTENTTEGAKFTINVKKQA